MPSKVDIYTTGVADAEYFELAESLDSQKKMSRGGLLMCVELFSRRLP